MRYFITGAAGFVGFHLARRWLEEGAEVYGFDAMTPYYSLNLKEARLGILKTYPKFNWSVGLLEDRSALERALQASNPDIFVHLAAQAGVRYSLENPEAYLESNITGSWNVLDLVRRSNVRHLMLASTSSVYGANPRVPFRETDRADEPLTFYAASKKSMEAMAHSYSHLYKIPITSFRFFTVYGPWGRPDMALFKFVKAILDEAPIEIYGHGDMKRDFTFIDDLIDAILDLSKLPPSEANRVADIDSLSPQAPYRVVNIGGGKPLGLLTFVDTIEKVMAKPAIRHMWPMQKGDVPQTSADTSLLRALTGRSPRTEVAEGVRAFVEWYLENKKVCE